VKPYGDPVGASNQVLDRDFQAHVGPSRGGHHGREPFRSVDRLASEALMIVVGGGHHAIEAKPS
jgi:hypothetical protein